MFSSNFLLKFLPSLHYATIALRDVLIHCELMVSFDTDLLPSVKKVCNYGCFTRMIRFILQLRGIIINCLFNNCVWKPQMSQLNDKQINSVFRENGNILIRNTPGEYFENFLKFLENCLIFVGGTSCLFSFGL